MFSLLAGSQAPRPYPTQVLGTRCFFVYSLYYFDDL